MKTIAMAVGLWIASSTTPPTLQAQFASADECYRVQVKLTQRMARHDSQCLPGAYMSVGSQGGREKVPAEIEDLQKAISKEKQ